NGDAALGLRLKPHGGAQGIRRYEDGAVDIEFDGVLTRRSLHIVDLHEEAGAITSGEETRKRARQHHGIANDHIGTRAADAVLCPGDSHDTHGAIEGRDVEIHVRGSVCLYRYHTG